MNSDIWKPINTWEGHFEVSDQGMVRSVDKKFIRKDGKPISCKGRILKGSPDKDGYIQVHFKHRGRHEWPRVHRLVAIAFIPNPGNKSQINHKFGIKSDNRASELEWATQSENELHSYRVLGKQVVNKKKIHQLDLRGIFITEWESISKAAKSLNSRREGIRDAIIGKQHTAYGFKWKYA